ncbi:MAG: J domain-containing protein [Bacteroidetes bacterium]|nr:J domain-containing protein [Bacteroidota bacterium]
MYDYYKILDIPRNASLEDIKHAYRNRAKVVHPDVNNSPKANEIFVIVKEAYEVLSDEHKRYLHDIKLNYTDAAKADAERKKQYFGSSVKNDSYTNQHNTNFHHNWNNFNTIYKEKTDEEYYKQSPLVYNMFFASGMFIGFLILSITLIGTYRLYWPFPFVLVCIPGIILIREGWKGMMGKKSIISTVIKRLRK